MLDDEVKVWVKTTVLDFLVFGKAHTSTERQSITASLKGDADPHQANWGWARGRVMPDDGAGTSAQHLFAVASAPTTSEEKGHGQDDNKPDEGNSSSAGSSENDIKLQIYIEDPDSEHNRTAIPVPATQVRAGAVVMANTYGDEDDYNDGSYSQCPYPDDLISLTHLHEPAVVYCLRQRYGYDKIYTATGPILLALNPFKNLKSLYSEQVMKDYYNRGESVALMSGSSGASSSSNNANGAEEEKKDDDKGTAATAAPSVEDDLPPHVYGIADHSFRSMMTSLEERGLTGTGGGGGSSRRRRAPSGDGAKGSDQAILVSGESGAGKTVTTKFIMQYLAMLSRSSASIMMKTASGRDVTEETKKVDIEQQVLQSNPILESFGNARTIRNDNSSRFGKYIEIQFSSNGTLVGASVKTYLLEKVRIITQAEGERNYHIFYEILQGGMSDEDLEKYSLSEYTAEDFRITSCSGTYDRRDGIEDSETYQDLTDAMDTMGFEEAEQTDALTVVCALLHASNLTMTSITADESAIDKENVHLDVFLSLMGFTSDALNRALCYFSIKAGRESHVRSLPKQKAEKGLEALVKAVYGALFDYIVERINSSITVKTDGKRRRPQSSSGNQKAATIGVLDIFGFESFQQNSFEQLCINYCNEALQQQFNLFVLKNEQEEYEREGIEWSFISFPENQDVLDLIGKKGSGIIPILDDQCRAPGTTDKTFANDIYNKCKHNSRFESNFRQVGALRFGIKHYAGPVEYDTVGFVEKNRDDLPKEASELLLSSTNTFVKTLAEILSKTSAGTKPGKKITVGGQFSQQLADLRTKIDLTAPHYVRCLKPNDMLIPDHFDPIIVADQLRCAGVVEAVRVSRVGYPQRYSHALFVNRYRILGLQALKHASRGRKKPVEVLVDAIAKRMSESEQIASGSNPAAGTASGDNGDCKTSSAVGIQVGKTKVFLKRSAYDAIEKLRNSEIRASAITIQTAARRYIASRYLKEALKLTVQLQCLARRMIATKRVEEIRRNHNARVIQTYYRRKISRDAFVKILLVVCWAQRHYRGRSGRARYHELNCQRKSIVIQKYVRAHQNQEAYSRQKGAALTVQCALRCYQAKAALKALKAHAKNLSAVADERNELRSETQRLREELEEAKETARIDSEKAAALISASESVEELKAINSKRESEACELRKELEALQNEVSKAKDEAAASSLRIVELQQSGKASLDEAKARATAADDAREKAEIDVASVRKTLEEALERERVAKASRDESEAKAKEKAEAVELTLQERSAQLSNLKEELETTKAQLAEAQQEIKTSNEEKENLRVEMATIAQDLTSNASVEAEERNLQLNKSLSEFAGLQKELEVVKLKLDKAVNDVETSAEANRKLQGELETLMCQGNAATGSSAEEDLVLLSDELSLVTVEKEDLEKRLVKLQESLGEATAEVESKQQIIGRLSAENSILKSQQEQEGTASNNTKQGEHTSNGTSTGYDSHDFQRLQEEHAKSQRELQEAQSGRGGMAHEALPGEIDRLKSENLALKKELLDAKSALKNYDKAKPPQKPMLSIPEDSEPDANMSRVNELEDEIDRLKKELIRMEEERSDDDAPDSLIDRYEELSNLSSALVEKDREIDDLKEQMKNLKCEFNDQVELFKSNSECDDGGYVSFRPQDAEGDSSEGAVSRDGDDDGTLPNDLQPALVAYRDEVKALREINEILRKDVERSRKACEMAKWELKEETARSAKELEAFAHTLRGVDELRAAAEAMSREITKNRKYYTTEDSLGAFEAAASVSKATKLLDASQPASSGGSAGSGPGLWGRLMGDNSQQGQQTPEKQQKEKGRRRRRRRGSGNDSVISAFF